MPGAADTTSISRAVPRQTLALPNHAAFFLRPHHWVAGLALKGFGKLRHVGEWTVHAESPQRMRVGFSLKSRSFDSQLFCPDLRPSEKKSLFGTEPIDVCRTWFAPRKCRWTLTRSRRSKTAGRSGRFRPRKKCCPQFGAAAFPSRSKLKRPFI